MIDRSRRHMRLQRDSRGYITSGIKNAKGYPQSLDHFDVSAFPEIVEAYGDKPESLIVMPPVHDIAAFFDDEYALWGKSGKRRFCTGSQCTHRMEEEVSGIKYGRGEISACVCDGLDEGDKQRCQYNAILKCYVGTPDASDTLSPHIYAFRTGSINSGSAILSELERMDAIFRLTHGGSPSLGLRPFRISVRMVQGKESNATKFPIWSLESVGFGYALKGREGETLSLGAGEATGDDVVNELTGEVTEPDAEIVTDEAPDEKPTRPLTPEQLRSSMRRKLEGVTPANDAAAPEDQRGAVIALSKVWPRDDVRHACTEYLTGYRSTREMPAKACDLLQRWIDVTEEEGGVWIPCAHAITEAKRVAEVATDDGRMIDAKKEQTPDAIHA